MIHYSEPVIHWYPQLTPTGLYPIPQSLHRYQYLTASQHRRNKRRVIAGELWLTRCFDALLRHKDTGRLVLADLKTQSSQDSKPRDVTPQLGGYMNLMDQCYPGIAVDEGIAIWSKPGSVAITTYKGPKCVESYLAARSLYLQEQPDF